MNVTAMNKMVVTPAQTHYSSHAHAISGLATEPFTEDDFVGYHMMLIGSITIKASATDSADATFTRSTKFGTQTASASQGVNLQTAYDNHGGAAEILTTDNDGEVILRRGTTGGDGDRVLSVQANGGAEALAVYGDKIALPTTSPPTASNDPGVVGQIAWDSSYIYVCTAANTWRRALISDW